MRTYCLVSGGLDSYLTWWITKAKPIFINYNQQYIQKELETVKKLYEDLTIIEIKDLPTNKNRYIPCRNLMFCTIVSHFDCDKILISGMDDDKDIDKSPKEFGKMSRMISKHANRQITIESPWWGYSKASAVKKYLELGGNPEDLTKTYSCYKPEKCYECDACYRWGIALLSNKINVKPPSINNIINRGIKQLWHRPIERLNEICSAMDFTSIKYKIINENYDEINRDFLNGSIVIVNVKCKIGDCTSIAQELRNKGYLFHGIVPFGK